MAPEPIRAVFRLGVITLAADHVRIQNRTRDMATGRTFDRVLSLTPSEYARWAAWLRRRLAERH